MSYQMNPRNSALDWLRGLAIILVVHCHAALPRNFGAEGRIYSVLLLGGKGVDLFFVLSGWLLGYQLLIELRDTRDLDVRRFWYRRWMRTLPAYYAVLLVTLAWRSLAVSDKSIELSYFIFTQNYWKMPYFGVSWSLCVEEYFYLFVAPTLLICFRHPKLLILLPLLLLQPILCRTLGWRYHSSYHETHLRWDQCAIGVLLAYFQVFVPRAWQFLCRLAPLLALTGLSVAVWNVARRWNPDMWGYGDFSQTVWTLIFGSFVLLANSPWYRMKTLRWIPVRYFADRSYAVYLLHGEAFAVLKRTGTVQHVPFLRYLMLTWVLSLAFAEVLYRTIERPFLRLRERFATTRSHGHSQKTATGVAVNGETVNFAPQALSV